MGNTVISGILFQPPTPPIALDYQGPDNNNGNNKSNTSNNNSINDNSDAIKKTLAKNKQHNISLNYIWLYSQNDYDNEWNLIPAVHITHNDANSQSAPNTQRYTLLYSHGNAEDIGLIASFLCDLARLLQINVMCYDYSGYGVSTEEATVAEFFKGFGEEIEAWKAWRITHMNDSRDGQLQLQQQQQGNSKAWAEVTARNGHKCRYSTEVFAAPMIHPKASSKNNDGDENGDGWDGMMFMGSFHNDEEDGGYDFSNACLGAPDYNNDTSRHDNEAAKDSSGANINNPMMSLAKRRQSFLRRNLWSVPSPSEMNCYANILSAYNYLTTVQHILPKHVILYGKSVGSGPTCWLSQRLCRNDFGLGSNMMMADDDVSCATDEMCNIETREPVQKKERGRGSTSGGEKDQAPGGVVLHSPFLSVIRVVLDVGFTTIGDLFPNIDRIGDFTCPVYVIHGSNDTIVPFYHGETLFQNLPDSSKTVPFWARGAGHNNIEMDMPTAYIKRLQQFIRQCDRLNYPSQMSARKVQLQKRQEQQRQQLQQIEQMQAHHQQQMMLQASLQASLRQTIHHQQLPSMMAQQQGGGTGIRPGLTRYASQDSYHLMMMQPQGSAVAAERSVSGGGGSSKPSKQRKQKGTLVMRSSHNHMQPPPPPPPPQISSSFNQRRPTRNVAMAGTTTSAVVGGPTNTSSRNWIAAHPSHPQTGALASAQPQLPQKQSVLQQQQMYAPNNNHVRYNQQPMGASNLLSSSQHSHPSLGDRSSQKQPLHHQQQMQQHDQIRQSYQ